jgi:hypothetical protein
VSVVEYTREEWQAKAEAYAYEALAMSFENACKLIEDGWHRGTTIEQKIRQFQWVLS